MKTLIATIVALISATAAAGQGTSCGPRDAFADALAEKYGEHPRMRALNGNSMMEIFVSPDGKTFSVLVTNPSKMSCLVSSGTDVIMLEPPALGAPS